MIFSFHQQVFVLLSLSSCFIHGSNGSTTVDVASSDEKKAQKQKKNDLLRGTTKPDGRDCSDNEIKYLSGSSETYPYKEPPIKIIPSSSNANEVTFYIQNTFNGHERNVNISVGLQQQQQGSGNDVDEEELCYKFDDVGLHEVMTTQPITASCLNSPMPYVIVDVLLGGDDMDQDSDILRDFSKYSSSVCWGGIDEAPKKLYSFQVPCGCSQEQERRSLTGLTSLIARSIDGAGTLGGVNHELFRMCPSQYPDGEGSMEVSLPNARVISNKVSKNVNGDVPNAKYASDMLWLWGQFIDHDLDLTGGGTEMEIPITDPSCQPGSGALCTVMFGRSAYRSGTGASGIPREHSNGITAFLDGSGVYGSDINRASFLRTWNGGRMKTTDGNLLPHGVAWIDNAFPSGEPPEHYFLGGDVRANENLGLLSMHTLFVREHNRIVGKLAHAFPGSTDEALYQMGRKIVGAIIQRITYNEFLPLLLGNGTPGYNFQEMLDTYNSNSYDPSVNPAIATEFSTCAFRVGHTLLSKVFPGMPPGTFLSDVFFQKKHVLSSHLMTKILGGFCTIQAQEVDLAVVDAVRELLFGHQVGGIGNDLVCRNIQRGRDHGIGGYKYVRNIFGMGTITTYEDISPNPTTAANLRMAYGQDTNGDDNVHLVDPWVGGLAEDHFNDAMVGPMFHYIIGDQFKRLMYGDEYFYLNDSDLIYHEQTLRDHGVIDLSTVTLKDILLRNLDDIVIDHNESVMKMGAVVAIKHPRSDGPPNVQCYSATNHY